jgi:hypothetical protein
MPVFRQESWRKFESLCIFWPVAHRPHLISTGGVVVSIKDSLCILPLALKGL